MLYQKGEKLEVLKETIKNIPNLSELKKSDFVMSAKEIKRFEAPILKVFDDLNKALYNTLLGNKAEEENRNDVYNAVGKVVLYLEEHHKHDLQEYFYEEKLTIYENMFVILVKNQLYVRYREYKDLLEPIPEAYWKLKKAYITNFPKISYLIDVYNEINEDIENGNLYDSTITYLNHSIESIFEEITELIKKECSKEFLNMDILPNMLRQLIYLLKSDLPIINESDEVEE